MMTSLPAEAANLFESVVTEDGGDVIDNQTNQLGKFLIHG